MRIITPSPNRDDAWIYYVPVSAKDHTEVTGEEGEFRAWHLNEAWDLEEEAKWENSPITGVTVKEELVFSVRELLKDMQKRLSDEEELFQRIMHTLDELGVIGHAESLK